MTFCYRISAEDDPHAKHTNTFPHPQKINWAGSSPTGIWGAPPLHLFQTQLHRPQLHAAISQFLALGRRIIAKIRHHSALSSTQQQHQTKNTQLSFAGVQRGTDSSQPRGAPLASGWLSTPKLPGTARIFLAVFSTQHRAVDSWWWGLSFHVTAPLMKV